MKKLIYAAGALTAGAATLCQTTSARADTTGKLWTINASVKGFYDNNMYAAPDKEPVYTSLDNSTTPPRYNDYRDNPRKQDSWGIDVSPGIRFDLPFDQGQFGLAYQFGMRYFAAREDNNDKVDYYNLFNADFTYNFSPRYKLYLFDSLAVAQEPEQLSGQTATGGYIPFRTNGDNVRNNAGAEFTTEITQPLSAVFSYYNNFYDFSDSPGNDPTGRPLTGNYGVLLNRMEQLFGVTLRYQILPKTLGLFGYQYGITDYDHKIREYANNNAHYIFGGVEHNFNSQLSATLRAGARITTFNDLNAGDETSTTPYLDFNVKYNYLPDSYAQLGVRTDRMASDVAAIFEAPGSENNSFVTDTQTSSVYLLISHAITPKLRAGAIGQFQWSSYRFAQDEISGQDETFIGVGATLTYQFTKWLAGEVNYYFDDRNSTISYFPSNDHKALDYTRHRVFFGVRFTY